MIEDDQAERNTHNYGSIFLIAAGLSFLLAATTAVVLYFLVLQDREEDLRLDIGLKQQWYYRRADWGALPEVGSELLDLPLPHVLIGHSALDYCMENCVTTVQEIQIVHMDRYWHDIGPNFLVGPNGKVFEGRGANFVGAMVSAWNRIAISVMFLGNYIEDEPTDEQFENVNTLLEELVRMNVLRADYTVLGHCQLTGGTFSPGQNVMDNMNKFEHWDATNRTSCLRLNLQ